MNNVKKAVIIMLFAVLYLAALNVYAQEDSRDDDIGAVLTKISPFVEIKRIKENNLKLENLKKELAIPFESTVDEVLRQEKIRIIIDRIKNNNEKIERIKKTISKENRIIALQRHVSLQNKLPRR